MNQLGNKKHYSSDEIWCSQRKELIKSVLETKRSRDLEKKSAYVVQQHLSEIIQFSIENYINNIKRKVKSRGSSPPTKR